MGKHADENWPLPVKKFWKEYVNQFEFELDEVEILRVACDARARLLEAKELLDIEGITFKTEGGQVKKHPAADVEKHSRAAFLQAIKLLNARKPGVAKKSGRPLIDEGMALV